MCFVLYTTTTTTTLTTTTHHHQPPPSTTHHHRPQCNSSTMAHELALGHLRYHFRDVLPQPNSPPKCVCRPAQHSKKTTLDSKITLAQVSLYHQHHPPPPKHHHTHTQTLSPSEHRDKKSCSIHPAGASLFTRRTSSTCCTCTPTPSS